MGTCRPDYASNVQERDISVTTPYGRIRGFYVHLFDGPGVPIGDRPGVYHNGKLWRKISTFLGIPYATPPVNEGRFKVFPSTKKICDNRSGKLMIVFYFLNVILATQTEKSMEYMGCCRFWASVSPTCTIRWCF